ncbi:hypothetical protein BTJ39_22045 [Izhakiella australiensis]|uniref:Glycosyltransferase family 1 protein n=1 Tax=Izhakiella australiensis TaxID=1926881 RepID=A0A1S8YA32_9GAMM|nr:glycosyltransferase family 4 protein [Izhakiella australiensis]OON35648.1 hypothetical protein BTJ39_22045 [Izhakiella australiensis]
MKTKICYFINSAWYFELHWIERATAVLNAGYDVYLLAKFDDVSIYERLTKLGFKCVDTKIQEQNLNPLSFLSDTVRSFKFLKEIDPDIVHSITIKPGFISCLWVRFNNKKLVYSFVGLGRIFESNLKLFKLIRFFVVRAYRMIFSNLNCKVIFEHAVDRDKIIDLVKIPKEKTIIIDGAGINIDYFSYAIEPVFSHVKVLFASRMLWSKGLDTLIKVKEILRRDNVNFELLVAGIMVNNDRDAIKLSQIELWHNCGDITWLGQRNDVKELIEGVNIVALPSVYAEGIPRIILEAGAIGRASVTYNVGGCGSLIIDGYNGFIVEKNNIKEFSDKLSRLIVSDVERNKMGINARKRVVESYSSIDVIAKTISVYQDL